MPSGFIISSFHKRKRTEVTEHGKDLYDLGKVFMFWRNLTLFLKQFLPGLPRLGDFSFPLCIGLRLPEDEEIAEVGLFPISDILALGFAALVVGMGVMKGTVEARVEVAPAVETCSASRNPIGPIDLLSTPVAYFHDSPF